MGVAVLHPQDFLKDSFARSSLSPQYPRNPSPHKPKKPQPNRRRRSPPTPPAATPMAISKPEGKKSQLLIGQVKILRRGEEIATCAPDLIPDVPGSRSTRRTGSGSNQIQVYDPAVAQTTSFYAGPVTLTSPPPSELPLPAFFAKKCVTVFRNDEATSDLRRILRLDVE